MSVIVKCEKPKSRTPRKSNPRLMIYRPVCPSPCPPACPPPCPPACPPPCPPRCPPPCQPVVQIVPCPPCRDTVVRCSMIQGGFLWNGVARLPCVVCPPTPPCYYLPCCPPCDPC